MKCLLDTHLLLWAAAEPERLTDEAQSIIGDDDNDVVFSAASIWEVVIKSSLGRADFVIDPPVFRRGLLDAGFGELQITGAHVLAVGDLPPLHRDPFDRLLVAQAHSEGLVLVTSDRAVAAYNASIILV